MTIRTHDATDARAARAPEMFEQFGGRVFFEFNPEAPPASAEPSAAAAPAPEDPPVQGEPPAPEGPAAPPPLSEDQIRQVVGEAFQEQIARLQGPDPYAPPVQPQPQEAPLPQWDPYDPSVVDAYFGRMLDQRLAPVLQQMGGFGEVADYIAEREAEAELAQTFERLAGSELEGGVGGQFDQRMARARAEALVESGVPLERALRQAAGDQRSYEEDLRRQGAEAYIEQARQLREQGPDPVGPASPPASPDTNLDPRKQARADIEAGLDPFVAAAKRTAAKLAAV